MYATWETTPGSEEISEMGRSTGVPGRMPFTLTSASLIRLAAR